MSITAERTALEEARAELAFEQERMFQAEDSLRLAEDALIAARRRADEVGGYYAHALAAVEAAEQLADIAGA